MWLGPKALQAATPEREISQDRAKAIREQLKVQVEDGPPQSVAMGIPPQRAPAVCETGEGWSQRQVAEGCARHISRHQLLRTHECAKDLRSRLVAHHNTYLVVHTNNNNRL